ncbi:MAG: ABC transporter ATP-binding protein [Christensenellales bacterium]
MAVIETKGLTKYYRKNRGILDVDIVVNEREIYGFIGPNGAGKSTMIKTLLNMVFPTKGSARIFGMDCVTESYRIKEMTSYVPNEINFYRDLTVEQMLGYSDSFYKSADKTVTNALIERFELEPKKKIGELSSGNRKKTALVAALSSRPKLLILDEPTNGLDPLMRQTLFDVLREQQKQGCTIFLSSHNLDEIQSLCERVAIIREGKIADVKTLKEIAAQSAKKVTVRGGRLPDTIAGEGIKLVSRTADSLAFTYGLADMKKLLGLLSDMDITDFSVEDIKLSDIFMSYYR